MYSRLISVVLEHMFKFFSQTFRLLIQNLFRDRSLRALNTWIGVNDITVEGQIVFESGVSTVYGNVN